MSHPSPQPPPDPPPWPGPTHPTPTGPGRESGLAVVDDFTDREVGLLVECERTIERGLKTFVEVGTALATIRDGRLYRTEYASWESYCQQRWAFTDRRARQLIEAAEIGRILPVANAGQANELARVPEEQRAEVWTEARERANGRPTAAVIRDVVKERTAPATPDVPAVESHSSDAQPMPEQPAKPDSRTVGGCGSPAHDPRAGEPTHVADARRDAQLDAELADTAIRFRRQLSGAIARADDLWDFDVDRIAEVYAADWDTELRPFLDEMTRWCQRVTKACSNRSTGLRVMQGGRR